MLTAYLEAAMRHAEYEQLPDGSWFGHIIGVPGVWAEGASCEECQTELRSALEDWLLFRLSNGFSIPVIDGIDLTTARVA
jgi:predicted RNase H-like HicB family nuclease